MFPSDDSPRYRLSAFAGIVAAISVLLSLSSCSTLQPADTGTDTQLRQTAGLVDDVKAFGKTLGIEPTPALSRTSQEGPALSMLWLWMQRAGTDSSSGRFPLSGLRFAAAGDFPSSHQSTEPDLDARARTDSHQHAHVLVPPAGVCG